MDREDNKMTVTHRLPAQPVIISDYDLETHSLTRIINSKIVTIYLKDKTSIADLARLSKIDDESFELMAYLQHKKEETDHA